MTASSGAPDREPVFLVGCGRSGTTLLRLMLNAHPDLAIPLESHFMYQIARLRARGRWPGEIQSAASRRKLESFLENHYYFSLWKMEGGPLRDRLLTEATSHSAAFRAIFREYAAQQGKPRWGDKTPRQVLYLPLVHHWFPDAKFIQVVRDGRDVALSLAGAKWGPRYIGLAGYYWKWSVLAGRLGGSVIGESRYREVRYEDLVESPEPILRQLCDWLGLDFTDAMLNYHRTPAAAEYARQSAASTRVRKPPDRRRIERWKAEMSPKGRRSLIRQAGALLSLLGYEAEELPAAQKDELRRLEEVLRPERASELADGVSPRAGPEWAVRLGLRGDRLAQLAAFFARDYTRWERSGLRWQRTVARMLS